MIKTYLSSDKLCNFEQYSSLTGVLYSLDVLNPIKLSGIPNHGLNLKVCASVMLLHNLDQSLGICNRTHIHVINLSTCAIKAEIICRNNVGAQPFILRIRLNPSKKWMPFKFIHKQLPLVLSFAMTINKSQCQSLSKVGLFL